MLEFKKYMEEVEANEGIMNFVAPALMGIAGWFGNNDTSTNNTQPYNVEDMKTIVQQQSFHNKAGYLGQPHLAVIQRGQAGSDGKGIQSWVYDLRNRQSLGAYIDRADLIEKIELGAKYGYKFDPEKFRFVSSNGQEIPPAQFRPQNFKR